MTSSYRARLEILMPKFLFPLTAHHLYGEVRILTTIAEFELFCQRHKVSEKHIFHSCYIDPTGAFIRTAHANERSEEHTSELQSLMRNSYSVFCLKKKKHHTKNAT